MQLKIDMHGRKDRSSLRLREKLVVPPHSSRFSRLCCTTICGQRMEITPTTYTNMSASKKHQMQIHPIILPTTGPKQFKAATRELREHRHRACRCSRFHNCITLVSASSVSDMSVLGSGSNCLRRCLPGSSYPAIESSHLTSKYSAPIIPFQKPVLAIN